VILLMDEGEARTVLLAASDLDMATSHSFFVVTTSPYDVSLSSFLQSQQGFKNKDSRLNILDSVFILSLRFPPNERSTSRQRRSVESDFAGHSKQLVLDKERNDFHFQKKQTSGYSSGFWTWRLPDILVSRVDGSASEASERIPNQGEKWVAPFQNSNVISGSAATDTVTFGYTENEQGMAQSRTPQNGELSDSWDDDIAATYDSLLLLGTTIARYVTQNNALPDPADLTSEFVSVDFSGLVGKVAVGNDSMVFYDAKVYDYDATEAGFVERFYLNATSPLSWVLETIGAITWPGGVVLPEDECFMQPDNCNVQEFDLIYIVVIFGAAVGIAVIATVVVFFIKRYWAKKEMTKGPNKVILSPDDLVFMLKKDMSKGSKIMKSRTNVMDNSRPDLLRGSDPNRSTGSINELSDFTQTARYNGDLVHVKELKVKAFEMKSKIYTFVRMLRDLRHENINPYVGFLPDPERPAMVTEYCSRGSLKGLRYMHNTPLKHHGHLTSKNCVIDSRFVLKITDYGVPGFLERLKTSRDLEVRDLLWTAPELLRDEVLLRRGTDKGDIYSISIIFQEVALRSEPYSSHNLTPEEIIKKVRKPPPLCRPSVSPQAAPPQFIQVMKQCWSEMPDMRPSIEEVYEQFKKLTGGK
ncbi:hypothetical protein BaRGS_00023904, partial [Batillaria attramentaria]